MATNQRHDYTEVKTVKFTYEWTIKNFQFLEHQPEEELESPHFRVGSNDVSWCVMFYPRSDSKDYSDYVSIFVRPLANDDRNVKIHMTYGFALVKTDKVLVEYRERSVDIDEQGKGVNKVIERETLIEKCKPDNSFTIRCSIERAVETVMESSLSPAISSHLQHHQLGEDYRRLLKNPDEFSDVTIIVEGKAILAHKLALIARSSVFAAMFRHKELEENCTNKIKIEDIEQKVVEAMLEFIYTDEVTDLEELADRLIAAAHKYDLARLITMCEVALCKCLNTKNAADTLILASLYGSQGFVDHVVDFVANFFRQGLKVENYEKVNDPELLRKVTFVISGCQ